MGTRIETYELRYELGHGGMGKVMLAYDHRTEREVALKLITPPVNLHEHRARFEREVRSMMNVAHSAIVPVLDYGESEGLFFIAMPFMQGRSLMDRVNAKGPVQREQVIAIVNRIAGALDALHLHQLIHRDVKPSNILFDAYGDAFLSDFGIVRSGSSSTSTGGAGSSTGISGTPAFFAPEMTRKEQVTNLVDVYALGVTVFYMLTARLPFEGTDDLSTALAHVTEPVPQIRKTRPDLPSSVQKVLDKALSKDPKNRYQTAGDMARELEAALRPQPKRSPLIAAAIAGILIITGLFAFLAFGQGSEGSDQGLLGSIMGAFVSTETSTPTITPSSTSTSTATNTSTPTNTPSATLTSTDTPTPTFTSIPTLTSTATINYSLPTWTPRLPPTATPRRTGATPTPPRGCPASLGNPCPSGMYVVCSGSTYACYFEILNQRCSSNNVCTGICSSWFGASVSGRCAYNMAAIGGAGNVCSCSTSSKPIP